MTTFVSGGELRRLSSSSRVTGAPIADPGVPLADYAAGLVDVDPAKVWSSQPSVRKVVGWIARLTAAVPFHVYERVSDTDRRRVTDHPLARLFTSPAPGWTPYRLLSFLVTDLALYDKWAAVVSHVDGQYRLMRLPAARTVFESDALATVTKVIVGSGRDKVELDPSSVVFDHGWAPVKAGGISPMRTLAALLAEMRATDEYRAALFKRGARVPAIIERPADAPGWSEVERERFRRSWQAFTRDGGNAGGTPILEDGMKLAKTEAFTPQDTGDLEGRKLTDAQVASAYHVAPELVGAVPGNYSNIDAFRQMIYGPTLGPILTAFEQAFNATLVPLLADGRDLYVEAAVKDKMQGSFIEIAQAASSAAGAPWATRNEIRAQHNLPAIPGGDELVVPLNVLTGGLASPRDTAPKASRVARAGHVPFAAADVKGAARPPLKADDELADLGTFEAERQALAAALRRHYGRTMEHVIAALEDLEAPQAGHVEAAFDLPAADEQLAGDLCGPATRLALGGAAGVLAVWNPTRAGWSSDALDGWLRKSAATHAARVNAGWLERITSTVVASEADRWRDALTAVLDEGGPAQADVWSATVGGEAYGFGSHDAAVASGLRYKRWIVTSSNPRPSHAAMNGETVPVGALFSNGARWPCDTSLDAAEAANCSCDVEYATG